MRIDICNDSPAMGEAQMVLGPLDLPPPDSIEDSGVGYLLIFRWFNNAVTLGFDGSMTVGFSYRAGGGVRSAIDFFIGDPVPSLFFTAIERLSSGGHLTPQDIQLYYDSLPVQSIDEENVMSL